MQSSTGGGRPLLYSSIEHCFNIRVFLLQFVIHFCAPFAAPLSPNPQAQGFFCFDASKTEIVTNYIFPILIVATVVSYVLSPDNLSHGVHMPLALYMIHRLMIALKYASMSEEEYTRLLPPHPMSLQERVEAVQYASQAHIISGLLEQNQELLEFQTASAAANLGLDLTKLYFEVPRRKNCDHGASSLDIWRRFLADGLGYVYGGKGAGLEASADESSSTPVSVTAEAAKLAAGVDAPAADVHVPLEVVAMSLIGCAAKRSLHLAWSAYYSSWVLLIFNTAQPFMILTYTPVSVCAVNVIYFTSSTLVMLMFGPVVLKFLTGCLFVALRQYAVAKMLHDLIKPELHSDCFQDSLAVVREVHDKTLGSGGGEYVFSDGFQKQQHKSAAHELFCGVGVGVVSSANAATPVDAEASKVDADDPRAEVEVRPPTPVGHHRVAPDSIAQKHRSGTGMEATMQIVSAPILGLSQNNALSYLALHQMMQLFGSRIRARCDIFISTLSKLMALLMLLVVVLLLFASDPSAFTRTTLFRQMIVSITMFALGAIVVVYVGGYANKVYGAHLERLAAHMYRVQSRLMLHRKRVAEFRDYEKRVQHLLDAEELSPSPGVNIDKGALRAGLERVAGEAVRLEGSVEQDEELSEVLEFVYDQVEMSNDANVVKFMGQPCDFDYAYSLFSALLTFCGYVAAAVSGNLDDF